MQILHLIPILTCVVFMSACNTQQKLKKEAHEDAEEFRLAKLEQEKFPNVLYPDIETEAVAEQIMDDAADDPAIWYNGSNPAQSVIIGSDKKAGIYLYDLEGKAIQFVEAGRINNVDLRSCMIEGEELTLVGGSNRTSNTVELYVFNTTSLMLDTKPVLKIKPKVNEVYGFTMYRDPSDGTCTAFVNGKDGKIKGFELSRKDNVWMGAQTYDMKVPSQPEGMVVNDKTGILYVGEEEKVVHTYDLKARGKFAGAIEESMDVNENIRYDLEGLALFSHEDKDYLIVSSQGNFSYAIFEVMKDGSQYITSFTIRDGNGIDGAEETDGIEIIQKPLADKFPAGILVVQDGFNFEGEEQMPQNYKIVDMRKVIDLVE